MYKVNVYVFYTEKHLRITKINNQNQFNWSNRQKKANIYKNAVQSIEFDDGVFATDHAVYGKYHQK